MCFKFFKKSCYRSNIHKLCPPTHLQKSASYSNINSTSSCSDIHKLNTLELSFTNGMFYFNNNILKKDSNIAGKTSEIFTTQTNLIKRLYNKQQYEKEKRNIEIICDQRCKYILQNVKFYDEFLIISMPKYDMDMFQYIENNGYLRQNDAIQICMNIFMALFYIHSKHLIYGDLKLENVCINKNIREPILIDIGSCSKTNPTITLETASPEALNYENLTYKHDIWTLGIFFMELTTSCKTITTKVYKKENDFIDGQDKDIEMLKNNQLFTSCTNMDPTKRICKFFS